jgi:hypothetical protein
MILTDTIDNRFDEIYQKTWQWLLKLRKDPTFTCDDLQRTLNVLYTQSDLDWTGRGMMADVSFQAQIAAHEVMLFECRKDYKQTV